MSTTKPTTVVSPSYPTACDDKHHLCCALSGETNIAIATATINIPTIDIPEYTIGDPPVWKATYDALGVHYVQVVTANNRYFIYVNRLADVVTRLKLYT